MKYWYFLFFLIYSQVSIAQIVIDDFSDGNLYGWVESATKLSIEDGQLKVVCNAIGGPGKYDIFFMNFDHLNMSRYQTISLKLRFPDTVTAAPRLRFDLRDINGYDSNQRPIVLTGIKRGDSSYTYTLNYTGRFLSSWPQSGVQLDASDIVGFVIYVNANNAAPYTGTFYVDDIVLEGAQEPNLLPYSQEFSYTTEETLGWEQKDFNDSSWAKVQLPASYNNAGVLSNIDSSLSGSGVLSDVYLRKFVNVSDTTAFKSLIVRVKADDGATIYINGSEVIKYNEALESVEEQVRTYVLPLAVLDSGLNVVAVHLQQANDAEDDLFFDINLYGSRYINELIRGPYLQKNHETGITLKWRTLSPQNTIVKYGLSQTNLSDSLILFDEVLDHTITLSGLLPNTKYYYTIGSTSHQLTLADSAHYFITHPVEGQAGDYTFWVIGDGGRVSLEQRKVMQAYLAKRNYQHTDAWLLLGDNAYQEGTDEEYQKALFENMFEDVLINTGMFPTPGNHDLRDYGIVNKGIIDAPYFDIFDVPTSGESGGVASGTESYYSWNYGNVHFISLDSYGTSLSTNDSMYTWLEKDLKENNQRWTVAYCHHPPHSKGTHDTDNPTNSSGIQIKIRENFMPLLEAHGVDLVVTGHSHVYERSYLSHGFYGYSRELPEDDHILYPQANGSEIHYHKNVEDAEFPNKGTVYAIVGCSGSGSDNAIWDTQKENYLTKDFFHYSTRAYTGSFILNIEDDTLRGEFLDNTGYTRDSFKIVKDNSTDMRFVKGVGARVIGGGVEVDWVNEFTKDSVVVKWKTDLPAESNIQIGLHFDTLTTYHTTELKTEHSIKMPLLTEGKNYYALAYNEHKYMINPSEKKYFDIAVIGIKRADENQFEFSIYPVPADENITVAFMLEKKQSVSISIVDADGRQIRQLMSNKYFSAGKHETNFKLKLDAGNYFVRTLIGNQEIVKQFFVK